MTARPPVPQRREGHGNAIDIIASSGEDKARDTRGTFTRLIAYFTPHTGGLVMVAFFILMSSLAQAAAPAFIGYVIDTFIAQPDPTGLLWAMLGLFGIFLAGFIGFRGQVFTLGRISADVLYEMRDQVMAAVQRLSLRYFDKRPVGDVMSRLINDTEQINNFLSQGLAQTLGNFVTLIVTLIAMFLVDWRLALISLAVLPVMFFAVWYIGQLARRAYRKTREAIGDVSANLEEEIGGVKVAQAFNRTEANQERFAERNRANRDANVRATAITSSLNPVLEALVAVATALVIGFGGWLVLQGEVTVGIVVAFLTYVQNFSRPVQILSAFYALAQGALAGAERIFELVDEPADIVDAPNAIDMPTIQGHVVFNHVTFGYDPARPVLKDISLEAHRGQTIALVGPTGAGKTTIVNLLSRFYEQQSGEIRIDGIDIRTVKRASLRRQLGVVLQDNYLFSGTIADNIRYGRPEASDAEVMAAAQAVNAHEFIMQLPDGYQTELGQRGGTLSQGQRQLISFARAILTDPRVLVLDEATSSVDTRTERLIQQALTRLLSDRTAFVIAHRLSTIRNADQVLVIFGGEIVERGTHDSLLALNGRYADLYRRQFYATAAALNGSAPTPSIAPAD